MIDPIILGLIVVGIAALVVIIIISLTKHSKKEQPAPVKIPEKIPLNKVEGAESKPSFTPQFQKDESKKESTVVFMDVPDMEEPVTEKSIVEEPVIEELDDFETTLTETRAVKELERVEPVNETKKVKEKKRAELDKVAESAIGLAGTLGMDTELRELFENGVDDIVVCYDDNTPPEVEDGQLKLRAVKVYVDGMLRRWNSNNEVIIPKGSDVEIDFGVNVRLPEGTSLHVKSIPMLKSKNGLSFDEKRFYANDLVGGLSVKMKAIKEAYVGMQPILVGCLVGKDSPRW